ncbi:MAG: ATP-binding cassette domain-containing protein [Deinococcales bacterium]
MSAAAKMPINMSLAEDTVLSVQDVSIIYRTKRGHLKASNHISFDLKKAEALALIGESGSGKTTVSLSLIDMLPKNAEITGGKVFYQRGGKTYNIYEFSPAEMRRFRWRDCAMVFQGAQNAFNPVLKVRDHF